LYLVLGHLCLREENQSFVPCLRSPMPEGGEPEKDKVYNSGSLPSGIGDLRQGTQLLFSSLSHRLRSPMSEGGEPEFCTLSYVTYV
jgi:hypothetical protein